MEKWYLLIIQTILFWTLKSCCFELFGDRKYDLLLSQKFDGKVIFTWSSGAFQDIPGLRKYGLLCSGYTIN